MDVAIGKAVRLSNADPLGQVRALGFLVTTWQPDVRRQCSRLDLLVRVCVCHLTGDFAGDDEVGWCRPYLLILPPLPPAISGDRWAHIGRCGTLLWLGSTHTGPCVSLPLPIWSGDTPSAVCCDRFSGRLNRPLCLTSTCCQVTSSGRVERSSHRSDHGRHAGFRATIPGSRAGRCPAHYAKSVHIGRGLLLQGPIPGSRTGGRTRGTQSRSPS